MTTHQVGLGVAARGVPHGGALVTHEPQVLGPAAHVWTRTSLTQDDVDLALLYDRGERTTVEQEAEATSEAGLGTELVHDLALPFEHAGGVRLGYQGQINPRRYLQHVGTAASPPCTLQTCWPSRSVRSSVARASTRPRSSRWWP